MPRWPHGPFKDLSDYPEARAHLRQVANLARDAERFREGQEMTRGDVAKKAGLNVQTYGDFEAGRTWPVAGTLYRIAEALDVDLRYLGRRPGRGEDRRAAGRAETGP
jgi:transcriptional regulator with XRE-family HTH domain